MDTKKCMFCCFYGAYSGHTDKEQVESLGASGVNLIMVHSMYAIIGAIALQKGGDVAARVAREKVLKPLGIS